MIVSLKFAKSRRLLQPSAERDSKTDRIVARVRRRNVGIGEMLIANPDRPIIFPAEEPHSSAPSRHEIQPVRARRSFDIEHAHSKRQFRVRLPLSVRHPIPSQDDRIELYSIRDSIFLKIHKRRHEIHRVFKSEAPGPVNHRVREQPTVSSSGAPVDHPCRDTAYTDSAAGVTFDFMCCGL